MSLRINELLIPNQHPFENCKLDRKKYADVLTGMIKSNADGFVLAINNKWGTGKSTFVKMWRQDLTNQGFKTIYFNSWENDFDNNPFLAITSELNEHLGEENELKFRGVLEKAAKISKAVLPALVEHFTKKYLGVDNIENLGHDLTEGSLEILEEEIEAYKAKKESVRAFKAKLEEFVLEYTNDKPLVFIVDELDRCRPNYAVEVLENIKHLFSVKGIVFVISIDKIQLGHAVRGVYGNDNIDSEEYLRRFIDIEYCIPEPEIEQYCKYLYDALDFQAFFSLENRLVIDGLKVEADDFLKISNVLLSDGALTLRQIEKIYTHARLSLRTFQPTQYTVPHLFLFLIYLKQVDLETYHSIKSKKFSQQDLFDYAEQEILSKATPETKGSLFALAAGLLFGYNNYMAPNEISFFVHGIRSDDSKLNLKSNLVQSDIMLISRKLVGWKNHYDLYNMDIGFFLEKIDLTEPFKK